MKKTFKQLLKNIPSFTNDGGYGEDYVLELLKQVREVTIKECIKKGYGLYYESVFDRNPTYVDIEDKSLEKLDKNSIEIYEI